MPSTCTLCRVTADDAHLAGDWHKYNEKMQAQGKMPMSQDLFETIEKPRLAKQAALDAANATSGTSTSGPQPVVHEHTGVKNVNQWHWEEHNLAPWAKERITSLLTGLQVPVKGNGSLSITEVTDVEGDAYKNMRKGKWSIGFEMKCKLKWKGEIIDENGNVAVSCTGTASIPDFSEDQDEDELKTAMQNIAVDKDSATGSDALAAVMKKAGRQCVGERLMDFRKEINDVNPKEI